MKPLTHLLLTACLWLGASFAHGEDHIGQNLVATPPSPTALNLPSLVDNRITTAVLLAQGKSCSDPAIPLNGSSCEDLNAQIQELKRDSPRDIKSVANVKKDEMVGVCNRYHFFCGALDLSEPECTNLAVRKSADLNYIVTSSSHVCSFGWGAYNECQSKYARYKDRMSVQDGVLTIETLDYPKAKFKYDLNNLTITYSGDLRGSKTIECKKDPLACITPSDGMPFHWLRKNSTGEMQSEVLDPAAKSWSGELSGEPDRDEFTFENRSNIACLSNILSTFTGKVSAKYVTKNPERINAASLVNYGLLGGGKPAAN